MMGVMEEVLLELTVILRKIILVMRLALIIKDGEEIMAFRARNKLFVGLVGMMEIVEM